MVPRIIRPYVYNNFFYLGGKIMKEKYYISTAIAYTSGKPHIGNTYEIVLALFRNYDTTFPHNVYHCVDSICDG